MKGKILLPLLLTAVFILPLWADQEASNIPVVRSGQWGRVYAKSIPSENYGTKGITKIYRTGKDTDTLETTFQWYSNKIYLQANMVNPKGGYGTSVVRFGPWARGRHPQKEHLAMAFYLNNRLLRRYSTLDIYNISKKYTGSIGHYRVIKSVKGYRWVRSNTYAFDIETFDGNIVSFNAATGEKM
jgi:hypothetical protein